MTARIREGELLLPNAEHRRTSVLLFPAVKGLEKTIQTNKQIKKKKKNSFQRLQKQVHNIHEGSSLKIGGNGVDGWRRSSEIFINLPKTGLRDWLSAGRRKRRKATGLEATSLEATSLDATSKN